MPICAVYIMRSPSGKVYIGQTVNLANRHRSYKSKHCKHQYHLYAALCKYGYESFEIENIFESDNQFDGINQIMDEIEISSIRLFKANDRRFGYNISSGGKLLHTHSDETKRKISIGQYARADAAFRAKYTDERRAIMIPIWDARSKDGGARRRLREAGLDKNGRNRGVFQYSLNGDFIREWDTATAAAKSVDVSSGAIYAAIRGLNNTKTIKGFIWTRYKRDKIEPRTEGQKGRKLSEAQVERMRLARIGKPSPLKGTMVLSKFNKKHTDETRLKMSMAKKGKPSKLKGIPKSEECLKRRAETLLNKKLLKQQTYD